MAPKFMSGALDVRWFCVGSASVRRIPCVGICVGSASVRRIPCVGICVGALVLLRWLQYPTQRPPMLGKLKNNQNNFISHKLRCIQLIIRTIKQGAYAFLWRVHSYSHKFAPKMRLNIFEFPLKMHPKFKNSRRSGSKTIIKPVKFNGI
jgi:hypothetical protein